MTEKPKHANGYTGAQAELVKRTCLYVATVLGDMMEEVVIVGGLVPSLIVDQADLKTGEEAHVGTMDLDIGFELAILDGERYRTFSEKLRDAGFAPERTTEGTLRRQRWTSTVVPTVCIDFLIPPNPGHDSALRLQNLEGDFAAIIIPGLHLAFLDRVKVTLKGHDCLERWAERNIWVCGPGAYVVLKALAHSGRDEPKDAYDLFYVLQHYGEDVDAIAGRLRPLLGDDAAKRALANLRAEYTRLDGVGPSRLATFLSGRADNDVIKADFVGLVQDLIRLLER